MIEPEHLPAAPWQALRDGTALLSRLQEELRQAEGAAQVQAARTALRRTEGWSKRTDYPGASVIGYFEARLHLSAAEPEEARRKAQQLLTRSSVAPEALFLLVEAATRAGDTAQRRNVERLLGKVLPLSPYGLLADRAQTVRAGSTHAPVIPALRPDKLQEVARLFAEMGQAGAASRAFREAIYGGFGPPWLGEGRPGSWLSEEAIDLWLELAEHQQGAMQLDQAGDSVARALIHGAAHQRDRAGGLVDRLERREIKEAGPAAIDGQTVLRIARLYAGMNLHPRAIALLRQHRSLVPAEAANLEQHLAEEWRQLLAAYCAGTIDRCVVFGQDVKHMDRPEEISIPAPADPAVLTTVIGELDREAD